MDFFIIIGEGNTDGIDISSSRDAVIENILIQNSDDGVCMNAGAWEFGMNLAIPTEDVLVTNVTCPAGGRGGFRVGIQPGGVRNVTYKNSVLNGERGLSLLGAVGGGGYIHDVLFENITNPRGIGFGNYAGTTDREAAADNRYLPKVWNVEFRDIMENGHCGNCPSMANGSVCPNVTFTGKTSCKGGRPHPAPLPKACPEKAPGGFVPWVKVQHQSNVYGQVKRPFNASSPGLPFLGLFATAEGCQAACEQLSNCTQYSWSLDVPEFEQHCYGRCDAIWVLHPVPTQYEVVAARRVVAATAVEGRAASRRAPAMRYGCKRSATDQFGTVFQLPWPVCIPLDAPVNVNSSWPNWGPVSGDYPSLDACKRSGCK